MSYQYFERSKCTNRSTAMEICVDEGDEDLCICVNATYMFYRIILLVLSELQANRGLA